MELVHRILPLLLLVGQIDVNFAESVCSPENRETPDGLDTCVQTIRDTMVDISAFWFGSDYAEKCPVPDFTIECRNEDPTPASMADRLFTPGTFDASAIETFMEVTVHEKPGEYEGCGHQYVSEVEADHPLDPIEPTPLTPWQSSNSFSAAVPNLADTDSQYTLVVQDVGHFFLHGVFINIPGDTLNHEDGEIIYPYGGSLYNRDEPYNPYIFMLFRQEQSNMELTEYWEDYFKSSFPDRFNNSKFASDQNLNGPTAVNWMMSTTDAYAAGQIFWANICPMFVEKAERELDLYHVPDDTPFSVSVNIDYFSVGMDFSTCCNDYSYTNQTYSLDPIGDGNLTPFDNKDQPMTVNLLKMGFEPLYFGGEMHTLLMIDPDIGDPTTGTTEKPLAHWLITNIPNGTVDQGDVTLSYRGSMLPAGKTHRYQFLLYQQNSAIDINPADYTPDCTTVPDRCLFEVQRFVSENNLTFLGATWYIATSDAYIAYRKQLEGEPAEDVCRLIPGYDDPCPSGKANFVTSVSSVVLVCIIVAVHSVQIITY